MSAVVDKVEDESQDHPERNEEEEIDHVDDLNTNSAAKKKKKKKKKKKGFSNIFSYLYAVFQHLGLQCVVGGNRVGMFCIRRMAIEPKFVVQQPI